MYANVNAYVYSCLIDMYATVNGRTIFSIWNGNCVASFINVDIYWTAYLIQ